MKLAIDYFTNKQLPLDNKLSIGSQRQQQQSRFSPTLILSNNQSVKMQKIIYLLIIAVCIFIQKHLCTSTAMAFSANYKYTLTGKYVISIANQIALTNSTLWSASAPSTVTITYPGTVYNSSVLVKVILGDFESVNLYAGISATLYLLTNDYTQMVINIFSSNASNIKRLTITYAIFNNNPGVYGNVAVYHRTFIINQTISSNPATTYSTSLPLPTTINTTGGASVCLILGGIDIYPVDPTTSTMDITNEGLIIDSSTLKLTVSSKSASPTYVLSITYIAILYNNGFLISNASTYAHLYSNVISLPNTGSFSLTSSGFQITDFNVFIGILSFSVSNQNSFNFQTSISNPDNLTITSSTTFNYAIFSYLFIYVNYCDYKTPFYDISSTRLCYDICPSSSVSNNVTLQCDYQSSTSSSSQSLPWWAIVIISIVSVTSIISFIKLCNYCENKRKNKPPKQDQLIQIPFSNAASKTRKDNLHPEASPSISRQKISHEQPRKQNFISGQQIGQQFSDKPIPLEPPRHRIVPDVKDVPVEAPVHHSFQLQPTLNEEWTEDHACHEQTCCICLKEKPFLRGSCNHEFHLTCLLLWRQRKSHCPLCRKEIKNIAKFYCKVCGKFYKTIDLNRVNPESASFKVACKNCPI